MENKGDDCLTRVIAGTIGLFILIAIVVLILS
jgi:hypothetical protein